MKANFYADHVRIVAASLDGSNGYLVHTGAGFLFTILIGTDNVNDVVVSAYDDVDGDTAANKIVPVTTYDASAMGINGFVLQYAKKFTTGLYILTSDIGAGEIVVDYRTTGSLAPYKMV